MSKFGATRNQVNGQDVNPGGTVSVSELGLSYPGWWAALQPADLEVDKAFSRYLEGRKSKELHWVISLAAAVNSSPWFCVQSDEALGCAS